MEYINIDLSFKEYSLKKKKSIIYTGIITGSILLSISGGLLISSALKQETFYKIKNDKYNVEVGVVRKEASEKEKDVRNLEKEIESIKIDEKKLADAQRLFRDIGTNTVTDIFNKIEKDIPNELSIEQFTYYEGKWNVTISYSQETKFMDFVNKLQKEFKDVFIIENKDGFARLEINM